MSWPKGKPRPPEVRAKISAGLRARLDGEAGKAERERLLRLLDIARQSPGCGCSGGRPRTRPPAGSEERRHFDKVADILGAAAAHAELRRGAP